MALIQMYGFSAPRDDRRPCLRDDKMFPRNFTERERAIWFAAWQALNAFCPDGQGGAA